MTATAAPNRSAAAGRRHCETNRLLNQAWTADPAERRRLLDEVVVANLGVARSIARRYGNRGIASEDLEQVACLGLVRAASRFDPTKSDDFLTYAVPTIRGEVRRYFRDHGWTIRPPRRIQELQAALNADAVDAGRGGGEDIDEILAARLGVTIDLVREARAAQGCFTPTSLDTGVGGDHEPLNELLADDEADPHDAVEARVILRNLTRELKPRDRLILYLRFVEGRTQAEIGEEIGVTQMQVSRLLNRILTRMRTRAVSNGASTHLAS